MLPVGDRPDFLLVQWEPGVVTAVRVSGADRTVLWRLRRGIPYAVPGAVAVLSVEPFVLALPDPDRKVFRNPAGTALTRPVPGRGEIDVAVCRYCDGLFSVRVNEDGDPVVYWARGDGAWRREEAPRMTHVWSWLVAPSGDLLLAGEDAGGWPRLNVRCRGESAALPGDRPGAYQYILRLTGNHLAVVSDHGDLFHPELYLAFYNAGVLTAPVPLPRRTEALAELRWCTPPTLPSVLTMSGDLLAMTTRKDRIRTHRRGRLAVRRVGSLGLPGRRGCLWLQVSATPDLASWVGLRRRSATSSSESLLQAVVRHHGEEWVADEITSTEGRFLWVSLAGA